MFATVVQTLIEQRSVIEKQTDRQTDGRTTAVNNNSLSESGGDQETERWRERDGVELRKLIARASE